jgi:hypothetical protein
MQDGYFGGLLNGFAISDPIWGVSMTATATFYTGFGFAIAADGRQRWEDAYTRDENVIVGEGEEFQKIFEILRNDATLAHVLLGSIANRDRTFDLGVETRNQIALLGHTQFDNCHYFLHTLADGLERTIKAAQRDGRLEDPPEAELAFIGYFKGKPCWIAIKFLPRPNPTGSLYEVVQTRLYPWYGWVNGSDVLRRLISAGDPRLAQYFPQGYELPHDGSSMQEAIAFAKSYVDACCSPLARALDPECEKIGGHVHIATVTPDKGFQWVIPPLRPATMESRKEL